MTGKPSPYAYLTLTALATLVITTSLPLSSATVPDAIPARVFERTPLKKATQGAVQYSQIRQVASASHSRLAPRSFQTTSLRWPAGQHLTVAFYGGTPQCRQDIADVASEWSQYGDISFDFGKSGSSGNFREWSPSDTTYQADIRISFDSGGYYSDVGEQSVMPSISGPGDASMNFEGFNIVEPQDWKGVVLHEFGHALGFQHEHQSPLAPCDSEFRWNPDPGYQLTLAADQHVTVDPSGRYPSIYQYMEGAPNHWGSNDVDANMRPLAADPGDAIGPFDVSSIMMYHFDPWMYKGGKASPCYTDENLVLSSEDKNGLLAAYPRNHQTATAMLENQSHLVKLIIATPFVTSEVRNDFKEVLKRNQSFSIEK